MNPWHDLEHIQGEVLLPWTQNYRLCMGGTSESKFGAAPAQGYERTIPDRVFLWKPLQYCNTSTRDAW